MSNTNNNQERKENNPQEEARYLASVYRYTCLGHVRACANEQKDDKVCRGIQYGLQHAAESHRAVSRQEATTDFAILNGGKDRHHGMPSSINDALKTQAIILQEEKPKEQNESEWNEIDSYGITDVEVLVLQDQETKKSQVTSVAPHCYVGNSVRDIGTKEGTMMSATIHLGPLEVTLDSGVEEQQQQQQNAHVSKPKQQEQQNARPARHDSGRPDAMQLGKKVANNMVKGASTLRDAMSEDFPSRMYNASHRVVNQMGKTVERTGKVAKSWYRVWFDADGDDEQQ